MKSIEELKSGKLYSELSNDYVPKTKEDEAKLEARKQLTKEQLFLKLKTNLTEAISEFQNDDFLLKLSEKIEGKNHKKFKTKRELLQLCLSFEHYLENLVTDREYLMFVADDIND